MQRITADVPTTKDPLACDTADGAILSAEMFDEDRHKQELQLIIGERIDSIEFGDDFVRMYIGRHGLSCHADDVAVGCDVFSESPPARPDAGYLSDTLEVRLPGHEFVWARRQTLDRLVGQVLRRVFFSPAGVFLYVTNVGILLVSVLVDRERSMPFLYWDFTD